MPRYGELFQSADWKTEKHIPVIECAETVAADDIFEVDVSLGKEVGHPNTTEHHIRCIQLFFKSERDKSIYQKGHSEFTAHGEAVAGANEGSAYTHHAATVFLKINNPGTLFDSALCNIHGLRENSQEIQLW